MHGKNPIRRQDLRNGDALAVEKIFLTVQGEGPFAGYPAIFIRLSGCVLRCYWCDTQFEEGIDSKWSVDRVLGAVKEARGATPTTLVVLTGGEPLRQDIVPLCAALIDAGFHCQIETAGINWVPSLEFLCTQFQPSINPEISPGVSIVVSPKTGKVNVDIARNAIAWKYIVSAEDAIDEIDGLPNMSTQIKGLRVRLARPPPSTTKDRIFLSPCDVEDAEKNQRNMKLVAELSIRMGYRVSLQTHKILGVE